MVLSVQSFIVSHRALSKAKISAACIKRLGKKLLCALGKAF